MELKKLKRNIALLIFPILLLLAKPCTAVFEGTANADIFIRIYKQHNDYGKLALWHETAAECLTLISIPMNKILQNHYKRNGHEKLAMGAKKEALEIQKQRQFHLNSAKAAWKKSKTSKKILNIERKKASKYVKTWLPHYPERFYDSGIYATFFRKQQELAELKRDYTKALQLEADAAEICAALYQKIPIRYGLKSYEKLRDAYLRHATLLRTLASRSPKTLPTEINIGKRIKLQTPIPEITPQKQPNNILKIAKSDQRVKNILKAHQGVREYTWFHGFAWTVSFYNHGWGNLAIAIVDDNTEKVLAVLIDECEADRYELSD